MINFSDIEKNRKNFSLSKMMFLEQNFGYLLSRLYAKTNCPWNFYRSLRTTKVLKFFFCEIWCAELILRLTVCEGKVVLWARKKLMSKSLKLYSLLLLLEKKLNPCTCKLWSFDWYRYFHMSSTTFTVLFKSIWQYVKPVKNN